MKYLALETYLKPFNNIFSQKGINEVIINKPGEIWVERSGDFLCLDAPELDYDHLIGMGKLVAQSTEQIISEEKPLLSATLPNGYRIQVVFPPAAEIGSIAISIRKNSSTSFTLDDYEHFGAFKDIVIEDKPDQDSIVLQQLLKRRRIKDFLTYAVLKKKNIIISGGTSTGKTTFTNTLLELIPTKERLITVEDAREITLKKHKNSIHLLASRGGQGRANVSTQDLIEACLRLRPDRIIVGELRGKEAFSFLRAINTGHPGSIATLHADSPDMAVQQMMMMVMQAGLDIPPQEIKSYITSVVDIVVQLKRAEKGLRYVSEIYIKDKNANRTR